MSDTYRQHDNKEFDVDTGTYMEDVHANDLIGIDVDGNGLVDNVEELIEEAEVRAKEYNEERERERERLRKDEENKDGENSAPGYVSGFEIEK